MKQEQITLLAQIYNALLNISTRGEDTLIMAQCLNALRPLVEEMQEALKNSQDVKE